MENYSLLLFITFSFMTLFLVECQVNKDKNPRPRGRSQVGFEDLEWIRREKNLKGLVDKEDKNSTESILKKSKLISHKNIRSWLKSKVNFTDLEWIRHEKKFLGFVDKEDNNSTKLISNKNIRSWLQSKVNFTDLQWIRFEKKFLGVGDQEDNNSGKSALKKCKTISALFTDLWCNTNCMSGFCPKTFCKC